MLMFNVQEIRPEVQLERLRAFFEEHGRYKNPASFFFTFLLTVNDAWLTRLVNVYRGYV